MKKLLKNIVIFAALSVAFSNFTACTNTGNTQKGPQIEIVDSTESNANSTSSEPKNSTYPPVPTGIMQAEIKNLDGSTFKVADKEGKVVLLNLWATWCGPCRAEMPEIVAMQDKYKDKGFEVYGLNVDDESVEDIKKFSEEMKLNYSLAYANDKMLSEFIKVTRLSGIPQTMVINREGKMILALGGGGVKNVNSIKETVEKAVSE